ncbi:trigger factor [Tetragenococcus halophilus]|uniref:Trigger factor n=1 Tax=Tetragenococcus halophilus (strain DSM 20338 / JCM 20259 / NCIMB 9735 / NBRC 12172) TaxID=945021 RepID=A0AAN1VR78_TETHN|nr:trigger factor [Tetragenococcus halophilus]MCO7027151.1 trigger factor [Tetragenococcus halophilus]MCO8287904.1 trigger factor [Tetragenococcus halophilus]MCO8290722.1 trigger factor [Tetragenococcus halophilus]MCO8295213.1 trigger factor [Tetragenococcus halophilus]NRR75332.1 trigger factor [Tetragenococcus halophilus]
MTAKWEKTGTNDGVLTFSIPQSEIQEGLTKTFNKVKKDLNIPGFRKGKVSRSVFNRMYGEEALYEDTVNDLLPSNYEAAVQEAGIDPVSQPKVDIESMEKGQDWVIKAEVTVKPEVKLGQYKDLKVEKQEREITDQDVEDRLQREQDQHAEMVIKEDEPAAEGDTVVIDFEGFVDGESFEGGKAENHSLELGSNSFIPGFEEQLVGVKAGDNLDVTVTFPEDYQAEDLAGKEAVFKVTVHEVKEKELPELDDELAKDLDDEVETLDELREKYHKEMQESKGKAAQDAVEESAIKQAVDNAEVVELPDVMIQDEVKRAKDEFLNNLQQQGISAEMYYQITGTSEEDLDQQFEGEAGTRVKTNLVIEAIVAKEGFEATEDEVNSEIKDLAENYNMPEAQVRSVLSEDMLEHDINMKKAVDLVTSTAIEE